MIYCALVAVSSVEDFLETYTLKRGPGSLIQTEDRYVSAGRDKNGLPTLYHVDGLWGYPITKDGIISVGSDCQIKGFGAVFVDVSSGSVMLAMEADPSVCVFGAEDGDGNAATSAQGPVGRNDPLTDARWNEVVRPTLIRIYPAITKPADAYRASNPNCTPLEIWDALIPWMRAQ